MIEIKNLSKTLGNNLVLDNVNLTIKDKSVFGLVGINGAGKSTLLRLISGIYKKDSGSILIDNEEVYENEKIKNRIFLISDDVYYPMNASINDLKDFYSTIYDIDEVVFQHYLEIFNLNPDVDIKNFSKGMKRQSFILLALAIKPKYLLLDEAFDGLDPYMRLTFKKALSELLLDQDITIVISSHNLRELEDICDSFAIIDEHTIHSSGDLQESKNNIVKLQVAFNDKFDLDLFKSFNLIKSNNVGKVYTLIFKGNKEDIINYIKSLDPILLEEINISFEEMFIYEMYERGHIYE